ncbi:BTAD domain-containing putative transcriptional regulator [Streptomyces gilvifuscus]|uniref:BTAD domain-containing putative transcriptional regulator n=1 Tax=Streptomyces gilvifuscus TaxID=1550617 RepID=A0ABT5G436_9ACTN|nr:BTAD domain-containing putative transcriptional regulator [Streptomyces gilvifuscus]MDC2959608.1 BTAD domain-containing putative transcriptional regulator [Streptomyces gilvifuscus]
MLRVQVLGPLRGDVDGVPVHLGSPRQRAVLALLLADRGRVVPVDRLVDGLWRGRPPQKAAASLHAYVSNLRRVLEPGRVPRTPAGVLVSAPPGYALRLPEDAVDAWRFEAAVRRSRTASPAEARRLLEEALGWWHGAAYGEWADEEWAAVEAARLSELHSVARELAVDAALASGDPAEAVPAAETLVREHPLREEGWRLLALGLWACGRRADALAVLRRAAAVMAEELGLGLGEALTELESAMLTGRTEVLRTAVPAAPRTEVVRTAVPAAPVEVRDQAPVALPVADEVFVGRDDELRVLEGAARDALPGGGVVLVTGEPGAGKSALLARYRRRLRDQGWTVVVGRCPEFDGAPSAWAWVEALDALARRVPPADPDALGALLHETGHRQRPDRGDGSGSGTAGSGDAGRRGQLGECGGCGEGPRFDEPGERESTPGTGPDRAGAVVASTGRAGEAFAGRFRLHQAFGTWLRKAAAEAPLAVIVDDLHRADGETLALLERAAGLVGSPVLVIAAYRPVDAEDRLTQTLAELAHRSPHRLTLDGLPLDGVDTLVRAVCRDHVDAATVRALAERTGGNPFYVRESARLLASEGALVAISEVPQGVRDVLRRRLRRLTERTRAVLRLAAVVGRETEVGLLVDAADPAQHEEHDVLDALEESVLAGLLTEPAPGVVRFAHALVRDTLYTDLVGVRRARLHARVADALRRRRPDDVAALAHHFARAASPRTAALAVEYSLAAADLAERRYAHDTAVELLTQAIESFARIPAVADDGSPARRAGQLVALLGRLLRAQNRAGAIVAARDTRQRAIEAAEAVGDEELTAAALDSWIGPGRALSGPRGLVDPEALDTFVDRLLARAESDPAVIGALPPALTDRQDRWSAPGDAQQTALVDQVAGVERRLAVARAVGDPLLIACALTAEAAVAPPGSVDRRTSLATELRVLGYAHDLPANSWVREHIGAMTAGARGDVAKVRGHAGQGLAVARRHRLQEAEAINLSTLGMLAHVEGRFADAEATYTQARELLRAHGSPHGDLVHVLGLTTVRLSSGRPGEAEPLLRTLVPGSVPTVDLALGVVLARQGEDEQAYALSRRSPAAVPVVPDHLYGIALSLRAELAFLLRDLTSARELVPLLLPLRTQLAGAASISFVTRPFAHSLGELYRLLGDEPEARRQFALAEDVARRWGSRHLAEAARAAAVEGMPLG